jgi:hypothetical protein
MSGQILQSDYSNLFPAIEKSQIINSSNVFRENFLEYPQEFGQGYIQYIELHQGFSLSIRDFQIHDHCISENSPEQEHPLQFHFKLAGHTISNIEYASVKPGETALCGCGMAPRMLYSFL